MAGRKQFDPSTALVAAMHVFWEYGYADTSLDALSSATGLGKGSLYGTFGPKDELFRRALDLYVQRWGAEYDRSLATHPHDAGSAVSAVGAFFEVVLARLLDPALPGGCLLVQSVIESPSLDQASRDRAQELLGLQYRRLHAVLASSGAPDADVDAATRLVVTVNQGLAVMHRSGAGEQDLRATVTAALRSVAHLLGMPPEQAAAGPVDARGAVAAPRAAR